MTTTITLTVDDSNGVDTTLMFPGLSAGLVTSAGFDPPTRADLTFARPDNGQNTIQLIGSNFTTDAAPGGSFDLEGNVSSAILYDDRLQIQLAHMDIAYDSYFSQFGGLPVTSVVNMTPTGLLNMASRKSDVAFKMFGGIGNDKLVGSAYSDDLDGRTGADVMQGFQGDDRYFVDDVGDRIIEQTNEGIDTVFATYSYTLAVGSNLENLTLLGSSPLNGAGNELANTLTGNSVANVLDGKAGADTMAGGLGNDTYYVDNTGDLVTEATGGGSDRVLSSVSYALAAGAEVELLMTTNAAGVGSIKLTGNEFGQAIQGNAGANVIDGQGGADSMQGFAGADTYFVDNAGDKVFEVANGGSDRVLTTVSYTLTAGAEVELLAAASPTGTSAINLGGNAFAQTIQGNNGANIINGGGGADTMQGFAGSDTYYVDNIGDKVIEAANGGADTVLTSLSYTLAAGVQVETLATTSAAGTGAINLKGNEFVQSVIGNAGANSIDGAGGADTMQGLGGNDTYYVDNAGDKVLEAVGGGTDTVRAGVSYALAANQEVETLMANAGTSGLTLTGNNLNNYLLGNSGADTLIGGLGKDGFTGGLGSDKFVFNALAESAVAAPDVIFDFTSGDKLDVHLIDADGNAGNGDTAFTLDALGDNSFATGHIKQTVSGSTLRLDFNTDADSASEMAIVFQNHGSALGVVDLIP